MPARPYRLLETPHASFDVVVGAIVDAGCLLHDAGTVGEGAGRVEVIMIDAWHVGAGAVLSLVRHVGGEWIGNWTCTSSLAKDDPVLRMGRNATGPVLTALVALCARKECLETSALLGLAVVQ